jgi:prepilin-type N-terminal cleavage/methylation domain-containing protein
MNKKGFTLIEAIIVISLFALIASLGLMQISFLDSTLVHLELNKLTAICQHLQQQSITTNSEKTLRCDREKNCYDSDSIKEKLVSPAQFGFLPGTIGSPGSASQHIKKAITFPGSAIHFYPTGIISSGTIYLTDKNKRYMFALSNGISKVSHLRSYRYDGKWTLLK